MTPTPTRWGTCSVLFVQRSINLLKRRHYTPDFIRPSISSPDSSDLIPVDDRTWNVLQQRVYSKKIQTVDELRQSIIYHLRNGNAWTSAWSTMQLNSGVVVFAPVWLRKAVISNSHGRTSYRKRYCMTNSFCVFNDFGRFGAIFTGIFLVVSACSLDVLEILCISEIDREQLRNQQRLFHNHIKIIHACFARFSCNLNVWLPK